MLLQKQARFLGKKRTFLLWSKEAIFKFEQKNYNLIDFTPLNKLQLELILVF